jgi:hypothetical protein
MAGVLTAYAFEGETETLRLEIDALDDADLVQVARILAVKLADEMRVEL